MQISLENLLEELSGLEKITNPTQVAKLSEDYAHFSPVLVPLLTGKVGDVVVAVDPHYYRPTEVDLLIGDPSKAHEKLGWKPKYDLPALVKDMMKSDLKLMKRQKFLKDSGYKILNQHE